VTFPKIFDLFEFCTDELKTSLLHGRQLDTQNREAEDSARLAGIEEEKKMAAAEGGDVEMTNEEEKKESAPKKLVGALAKAAKIQD